MVDHLHPARSGYPSATLSSAILPHRSPDSGTLIHYQPSEITFMGNDVMFYKSAYPQCT